MQKNCLPAVVLLPAVLLAQEPAAPVPPAPRDSPFRLTDVHLDVMVAGGGSTASDAELRDLQAGHHDPRQRGFTLQQAELTLAGEVDRWFDVRVAVVGLVDPDGETVVELEEAFAGTRELPAGLRAEVGTFLTAFGRANQRHSHEWDWLDQPFVLTRLLGGDGLRGPGARLRWAANDTTELIVGLQDADGEGMPSFGASSEVYEERPIGGRFFAEQQVHSLSDLVWSARAAFCQPVGESARLEVGASAAFGPNATGDDTAIGGFDFALRFGAHDGDWQHAAVRIEGEWLARRFDTATQVDEADPLNPVAVPADTLRDHGAYVQIVCAFDERWSGGLRAEWARGSGSWYDQQAQVITGRDADPFGADRIRLSPLLTFAVSPTSRLRLQYSYDDSDHLDDAAHSVWLGVEVLLGSGHAHAH